jgi:hypothetical protein
MSPLHLLLTNNPAPNSLQRIAKYAILNIPEFTEHWLVNHRSPHSINIVTKDYLRNVICNNIICLRSPLVMLPSVHFLFQNMQNNPFSDPVDMQPSNSNGFMCHWQKITQDYALRPPKPQTRALFGVFIRAR